MFTITKIPIGNTFLLKLSNENTGEYVTIFSEIGACLHQVCLACHKTTYSLLWAVNDAEELYREGLPQYRGALLFPFVDRIEKGKYVFEEVEYSLPCNEANQQNALHGFLNTKPFEVVTSSADSEQAEATLFFEYKGDHQGYPFAFTIAVCYRLTVNRMSCSTSVQNQAGRKMPIGMGWHPYFKIAADLLKYEVSVPAISSFVIGEDYINKGEQIKFNGGDNFFSIDTVFFNAYALRQVNGVAKTVLRDKEKKIDISINSTGFPFLQLYVVAGKGIAIEPLTCIGNAFNNRAGLIVLSPGEIMENSFEIAVYNS